MNLTKQTLLFDHFLTVCDYVFFILLSLFCSIVLHTFAIVICIKLLHLYIDTFLAHVLLLQTSPL